MKKVEDVLKDGIYGKKELKVDEKRMFLGTYRERVYVALSNKQVREPGVYDEVEHKMREVKDKGETVLLLNGKLRYSTYSNYIKLASTYNIPYKIVSDLESTSQIGLVLASSEAVDVENIYVKESRETEGKQELTFLEKMLRIFK